MDKVLSVGPDLLFDGILFLLVCSMARWLVRKVRFLSSLRVVVDILYLLSFQMGKIGLILAIAWMLRTNLLMPWYSALLYAVLIIYLIRNKNGDSPL